jgi:predicted dehydrogenase
MQNKVRWGVIGSGGIASRRTIPEGILPAANAELRVVYDVNPAINEQTAQRFKAQAACSVEELLQSEIDAVYIASPPTVHCAQALACAASGKHVLSEKPLGMKVSEAETMIAACQKAKVKLGTAFMMRFQSQHQAALKLVREGKLGQPVFARAQLSCWYPPMPNAWRQDPATGGGGSLMDMGGHCIDLLEMFFGPVSQVSCFINRTIHSYASEDSAIVNLQFKNGALAVVDAFFCIPDAASQNRLELYGSLGSILAKGTIGQGEAGEMTACLQAALNAYDAQQNRTTNSTVAIAPAPVNMYRAEIEEFSQAILENRDPLNHAQLGLQSQRILDACYLSAQRGASVKIIT